MFKKNKLDKNLIMSIQPTSIASLKSQCYLIADGDIEEAKKLYDYFISDMDGLPMFDPQEPSKIDKVKDVVSNGVDWIKENKDGLMQAISMVQSIMGKGGAPLPGANVPPSAPLNPIN